MLEIHYELNTISSFQQLTQDMASLYAPITGLDKQKFSA